MQKEHKGKIFFRQAKDGSAKAITLVAVVSIALMLSVGITLAQQTQGNTVVDQIATTATVDDGCPCHQGNGGAQTMSGGQIVCPGIISGIGYIQSQGETWYNAMVQAAAQQGQQYYLRQMFGMYRGEAPVMMMIGGGSMGTLTAIQHESISSVAISDHVTPYYPNYGFLSWSTLQTRFAAILAYDDGTGPVPSFWTPTQLALYTSTGFCNNAQNCFWMYAVGQTWLAGVWMALGAAGQQGAGLEMWLIGQVGLGALLVECLGSVTP